MYEHVHYVLYEYMKLAEAYSKLKGVTCMIIHLFALQMTREQGQNEHSKQCDVKHHAKFGGISAISPIVCTTAQTH